MSDVPDRYVLPGHLVDGSWDGQPVDLGCLVCTSCGALVVDEESHDAWHARIAAPLGLLGGARVGHDFHPDMGGAPGHPWNTTSASTVSPPNPGAGSRK